MVFVNKCCTLDNDEANRNDNEKNNTLSNYLRVFTPVLTCFFFQVTVSLLRSLKTSKYPSSCPAIWID